MKDSTTKNFNAELLYLELCFFSSMFLKQLKKTSIATIRLDLDCNHLSELVIIPAKQRHLPRAHDVVIVGRSDDVDRVDVLERAAADLQHDDAVVADRTFPLVLK